MDSFAVRTTVAVAGLAALGVGLATPAFAAPNVSGVGNTSSPTASPAQLAGASQEAFDAMSELPGQFHFEMPTVNQSPPTDALPEGPMQ